MHILKADVHPVGRDSGARLNQRTERGSHRLRGERGPHALERRRQRRRLQLEARERRHERRDLS